MWGVRTSELQVSAQRAGREEKTQEEEEEKIGEEGGGRQLF